MNASSGPLRLLKVPIALAVAAFSTIAVCAAAPSGGTTDDAAVVRVEQGLVRGTVTDSVRLFQGIPYAAPPVGELRWGSPRPAASWTGTRDATRPSEPCAQGGDFIGDKPSVTEDCLYLNVTTPRETGTDRPVMVWMHGGGFLWGSGAIYGAERLAAQGEVILVTLNYRLGVFGFLAHPALDGGPADHMSGNLGVEDQQAALRWVRQNAAAFGGDPDNVTIFGESAGAMVSCTHLTVPGSAGLFDKVIMQSGPCMLQWPFPDTWRARPRADAVAQGLEVATAAGCPDAATAARCLHSKPAADLLDAAGERGFGPVYGGGVIPEDPARQLEAGHIAQVPVMHGITRDEHVTFQAGFDMFAGEPIRAEDYPAVIGQLLGLDESKAADVARAYPLDDYDGSASWALSSALTDWAWACPAVETNRMLGRAVPTYAFEFADETAPWFREAPRPGYPTGAYHAAELQYLFSGAYAGADLTPAQKHLSDQMIRYWTTFAHSGDPDGDGSPEWPRYSEQGEHVQSLETGADGIKPVDLAGEHRCGFWKLIS
jgi:para-nitrobenzyl esterase